VPGAAGEEPGAGGDAARPKPSRGPRTPDDGWPEMGGG